MMLMAHHHTGHSLAYQHQKHAGHDGGILFLPGLMSDMMGTKSLFLADNAPAWGLDYTSLDYRGHGSSDGDIVDGTISMWLEDAAYILASYTKGPQIVVGSSMGGWLAMHLAKMYPEKICAVVGIAAAPDFTGPLLWDTWTTRQRQELEANGFLEVSSDYEAPYIFTKTLIEDGKQHFLLQGSLNLPQPLRLLQGMQDIDVPWQHAMKIMQAAKGMKDAQLTLIEGADHRLSRAQDLAVLRETISALVGN